MKLFCNNCDLELSLITAVKESIEDRNYYECPSCNNKIVAKWLKK